MAVAFEDGNEADPTDLLGKLHQITLPYDTNDVTKWVKRLEVKMETFSRKQSIDSSLYLNLYILYYNLMNASKITKSDKNL